MVIGSAKPFVQRPAIPVQVVRSRSTAMLFNTGIGLPSDEKVFELRHWQEHHLASAADSGRGAAWFVEHDDDHLVLRHFRRGGALQRLLGDNYLFAGLSRTRSFAEFRLLSALWSRGLPVPEPVGARVQRRGLRYTADLLIRRIMPAVSWSAQLLDTLDNPQVWASIGRMIADFHACGVCHADLNAHNILINAEGRTWLIDFDKGSLQKATAKAWRKHNLARLQRSIAKLLQDTSGGDAWRQNWSILEDAYGHRFMERHYSISE